MTSNVRLTFGGSYFYTANKVSADANSYGYEINTLLTIQFLLSSNSREYSSSRSI